MSGKWRHMVWVGLLLMSISCVDGSCSQEREDSERDIDRSDMAGDARDTVDDCCTNEGEEPDVETAEDTEFDADGDGYSAVCGNGVIDEGEACDDNELENATCSDDCTLTCSDGFADCNSVASDGCEVRTADDPEHCGECARNCKGSVCVDGYCQPSVVWWGPEGSWADNASFVLHGGRLHYTVRLYDFFNYDPPIWTYGINSVPTDKTWEEGASEQGYISGETEYWRLRFDQTHIYWVDRQNGALRRRLNERGQGARDETYFENVDDFEFYDVGETHLYWSDPVSGVVKRTHKDEGTTEEFVATGGMPKNLVLGANHLFVMEWFESVGSARLLRVDLANASTRVLAETTSYGPLLLFDGRVFWMNRRTQNGYIKSVSVTGGDLRTLKEFTPVGREDFAVDDDHVYWATNRWVDEDQSHGVVTKIDRSTLEEEVLVSNQTFQELHGGDEFMTLRMFKPIMPNAVAVANGFVFWLERDTRHVLRVAK